jgi:hypothetical protein
MMKGIFREAVEGASKRSALLLCVPSLFACLVPYAAPRVIVVVLPFGLPNWCV